MSDRDALRRQALDMLDRGVPQAEVAEAVQRTPRTLRYWLRAARARASAHATVEHVCPRCGFTNHLHLANSEPFDRK